MLKLLRRIFWIENHLKIEGYNAERFLNLCAKNNILLEEIERVDQSVNAVAYGFCDKKLKELSEKAGTELSILKKSGLMYRFMMYRLRIAFYIMPLLCMITLYLLSGYIWAVEVTGNQSVSKDMLYDYLKNQQWFYGDRISSMDPEYMEEQLRIQFPVITWVNVVIDGTCLIIDIKENDYLSGYTENDTSSEYGNLIALEQGTVSSIVTRSGVPQCKAGDTVSQGQILVTGEIPIYNNTGDTIIDYRYVAADADVMLQYQLTYLDYAAYEVSVKEYTGEYITSYFLSESTETWKINEQETPYATFDSYSSCYQLRCMDNFYLPCYYGKTEYRETCFHNIYRNESQLQEILLRNYENYLNDLKDQGIEVLGVETEYIPGTQGIYLTGHLTVNAPGGSFFPLEQPVPPLPAEDILTE